MRQNESLEFILEYLTPWDDMFDSFALVVIFVNGMAYKLFLFDADDTLFDFKATELSSFNATMSSFGIHRQSDLTLETLFRTYKSHVSKLWRQVEQGTVTLEFLKAERFKLTFENHRIDVCPVKASKVYMDHLTETVHLVDFAKEICSSLATRGELGIITNGIESIQKSRLEKSGLAPYFSFMATSEGCGFAKPDTRIFEYAISHAKYFSKPTTLMIGDRLEADIDGAHAFGVDACWFNPTQQQAGEIPPKFNIQHLSELEKI